MSNTIPQNQRPVPLADVEPTEARQVSEPVLVVNSVIVGAHVLFAGGAIASGVSDLPGVALVCAFGNLAVAAIQQGMAYYVRGKVTPTDALGRDVR